jgi:hypothetical protein
MAEPGRESIIPARYVKYFTVRMFHVKHCVVCETLPIQKKAANFDPRPCILNCFGRLFVDLLDPPADFGAMNNDGLVAFRPG